MQINWKKKALKQLIKVQAQEAKKIKNQVSELATFPNCNNVKSLKNYKYQYRLRVGNYRVFFDIHETVEIISIEEVKKRDDKTYH